MSKILFAIAAVCLAQVIYIAFSQFLNFCFRCKKNVCVFLKYFLCVFFLLSKQLAFCRVAREAPAANPWLDAWNLANETIEQFHRSFLNIAGVQSDAELWGKARTQFTTYENTLRSGVASLEEEVRFVSFCFFLFSPCMLCEFINI